jgi:hypothetical protein
MKMLSLLFVAMVALFATPSVLAEAPGVPLEFNAYVLENGTSVKLAWMAARTGDDADKFNIYMAEGETELLEKFSLIATVDAPDDTPNRPSMVYHVIENVEPGVYTFFVKAANDDGESGRTKIKVVVVKEFEATLRFVSEPNRKGVEGKPWRYEARAKGNVSGGKITYSLTKAPEGVTINEETGLVTWENAEKGEYVIVITATWKRDGEDDVTTSQDFRLEIGKGDDKPNEPCATIYGGVTVTMPDGSKLEAAKTKGVVIVWGTQVQVKENGDTLQKDVVFARAEIKNGEYIVRVPAGNYRVRVEGEGFMAEWYSDATEAADATVVEATCDTRTNVSFEVEGKEPPRKVVVEGTVTDQTTGEPLRAVVVFESVRGNDDNEKESRGKRVAAETKADGSYRIEILAGVSYIAYAKGPSVANSRPNYLTEFYNETADATAAEIINLEENKGDVNFTLEQREARNNGLSGTVTAFDGGEGVPSFVAAFMVKSRVKENGDTSSHKERVVSVETDAEGNFSLMDLEPGDYILFAKPMERPYLPGWYTAASEAAKEWKEATVIGVSEVGTTEMLSIQVSKSKAEAGGRGKMRGWVFDKRGGIINKGAEAIQANAGISGSLVSVRNIEGEIVDALLSATDGGYSVSNLEFGIYTVVADRVFFNKEVSTVTISSDAPTADVSFALAADVTSVEVPIDLVGQAVNLYPNPTSSTATLEFTSTVAEPKLEILTATGVVVATQALDAGVGTVRVSLNTSTLPAGMVYVRVYNGTTQFALPLTVVR